MALNPELNDGVKGNMVEPAGIEASGADGRGQAARHGRLRQRPPPKANKRERQLEDENARLEAENVLLKQALARSQRLLQRCILRRQLIHDCAGATPAVPAGGSHSIRQCTTVSNALYK